MIIKVEYRANKFLLEERDYQRLYSKGSFGYKEGNYFELDVYEVLFLLEKGRADVYQNSKQLNFDMIVKKTKIDLNNFIIYRDLKSKGYVIKSGFKYGFLFRVYEKGVRIGQKHSTWLVEPLLEKSSLKIKDIAGKNRISHSTRKKLLYAIVDMENCVTYIETSWKRI